MEGPGLLDGRQPSRPPFDSALHCPLMLTVCGSEGFQVFCRWGRGPLRLAAGEGADGNWNRAVCLAWPWEAALGHSCRCSSDEGIGSVCKHWLVRSEPECHGNWRFLNHSLSSHTGWQIWASTAESVSLKGLCELGDGHSTPPRGPEPMATVLLT